MESSTPSNDRTRHLLEWGGFVAGVVLIAFGIAAIVMGFDGRSTVRDNLAQENIIGSDDMTPELISEAAGEAGLTDIEFPDKAIAGDPVDTGDEARTFAEYMRIHALESTGGFVYSEMGRFQPAPEAPKSELEPGGGTSNPEFAVLDPETGQPVANGLRDLWVTETALATALNTSYMAERLSVFGIVVGIALLLSGIGFIVLAYTVLHRRRSTAASLHPFRSAAPLRGAALRLSRLGVGADEGAGGFQRPGRAAKHRGLELEVVPETVEDLELDVAAHLRELLGKRAGLAEQDLLAADLDQRRREAGDVGEER